MEDEVPHCETIHEEKCEDVVVGLSTEVKCDSWPRVVCNITREAVKKYTPETSCEKVPKTLCSPAGCGVKQVNFKLISSINDFHVTGTSGV